MVNYSQMVQRRMLVASGKTRWFESGNINRDYSSRSKARNREQKAGSVKTKDKQMGYPE